MKSATICPECATCRWQCYKSDSSESKLEEGSNESFAQPLSAVENEIRLTVSTWFIVMSREAGICVAEQTGPTFPDAFLRKANIQSERNSKSLHDNAAAELVKWLGGKRKPANAPHCESIERIFPSRNYATIEPIYVQKGDPAKLANYRPESVTHSFCDRQMAFQHI